MKALVVEDNMLLGKSIRRGLEEAGWAIDLALDGVEARYYTQVSEHDVIVLDWMLPRLSGLELLRQLRDAGSHVPVLMLSARGDLRDRVEGLDQGADDYLVKPFEMSELVARLNALHRRSAGRGSSQLDLAKLSIDLAARRVAIAGQPLELTGKEYDLLVVFAGKPGQLLSRRAISGLLYPLEAEPESNSLDVLLNRLRRKLAGAGVEIETQRGKGYLLRVV